MSKYRVFELAKELNTNSKILIDLLARNGFIVRNHMASIGEEEKKIIDKAFAVRSEAAKSQRPVDRGQRPTDSREQRRDGQQANRNEQRTGQNDGRAKNDNRWQANKNNAAQGAMVRRPNDGQRNNNNRDRKPNNSQTVAAPRLSTHGPAPVKPSNEPQLQATIDNVVVEQQVADEKNTVETVAVVSTPVEVVKEVIAPKVEVEEATVSKPVAVEEKVIIKDKSVKPAATNTAGKPGRKAIEKTDKRGGDKIERREQALKFTPRGAKQQHSGKNKQKQPVVSEKPAVATPARPKVVKLPESITVKELSAKFGREANELIKKLMLLGVMATINQEVDFDTAGILAAEFNITVEALPPEADLTQVEEIIDDPADLVIRPPVVTVMGHVDHGKTSLLDAIRKTKVTSTEAGGITQHIGAYQVTCKGKKICFLDTPGHEAFTSMRARGAQVTDIAILVVAADDGVMPQTVEAINHAKAANVPIIVAINKIDKEGSNPDKVKQQLTEYELVGEEWGGDVIMVPVSAHKKTGLEELLEMILLVAEVQELKANPHRRAMGTIVEAQLDKGRGPVSTILVQKGTLSIGDMIIAGSAYGRVRAMINDRGEKVKKAGPSTPVEVLGLSDVPSAGDVVVAVDERTARVVAEKRVAQKRIDDMKQKQKVSLEDLFNQIKAGEIKDLNIVVKADVQGSIEALRQALVNLKNSEVRVNIVHSGVGAINESDIMLAAAANALVIGFNVRPDNNARRLADAEAIDMRMYRVIYEAINDVEAAMNGMLAPEFKEVIVGRVEVRQVFSTPKAIVAGSYVLEGKVTNSSQIRLIRDNIVIQEGKIESLRRFKDDVKEVAAGYECGISIEKYRDIRANDVFEVFAIEEIKRS